MTTAMTSTDGGTAPRGAARSIRPDLAAAEVVLVEAVDTLGRLPSARVRPCLARWPAIIRAAHEAYGYAEARPRRAPASHEAITRLDHTLEALRQMVLDDQRLVWSRANGFSWRAIAARVGAAPNTCRSRYLVALARFAAAYALAANRAGP